jgi:hypothetical protein
MNRSLVRAVVAMEDGELAWAEVIHTPKLLFHNADGIGDDGITSTRAPVRSKSFETVWISIQTEAEVVNILRLVSAGDGMGFHDREV